MNAQSKGPRDSSDLAILVCLLQSYEHYGNRGAPPGCLDALAADRGAS